jgi:mono/diheme cytochrome c family protein
MNAIPARRDDFARGSLELRKYILGAFVLFCLAAHFYPLIFAAPEEESLEKVVAAGRDVYSENCSSCHRMDGSGLAGAQPALVGNDFVTGDSARLVRLLLKGAVELPPSRRAGYYNVMPPFGFLSDRKIAEVLTYVRYTYGPGASAITPEQVGSLRTAKQPEAQDEEYSGD